MPQEAAPVSAEALQDICNVFQVTFAISLCRCASGSMPWPTTTPVGRPRTPCSTRSTSPCYSGPSVRRPRRMDPHLRQLRPSNHLALTDLLAGESLYGVMTAAGLARTMTAFTERLAMRELVDAADPQVRDHLQSTAVDARVLGPCPGPREGLDAAAPQRDFSGVRDIGRSTPRSSQHPRVGGRGPREDADSWMRSLARVRRRLRSSGRVICPWRPAARVLAGFVPKAVRRSPSISVRRSWAQFLSQSCMT